MLSIMHLTLPYNPFCDDTYKMTLGVQALDPDCLIEIDLSPHAQHKLSSVGPRIIADDLYHHETSLKEQLLRDDYDEYCYASSATLDEQWEVLALLLPNMARHHPEHFTLHRDGQQWIWHNRLLATETTFQFGEARSLPLAPLDWLGRQVQEDLLILSGDVARGMPLIGGHLCFPNDWCLRDKLDKPFLHIHAPVPLFTEQVGRSSLLLLERLKIGRPVWRVNWAFKATSELTLTPQFVRTRYGDSHEALTLENIGERCMLRVERQTLSRLPQTRAILFSVHTYLTPLAHIARDATYARRAANVIRTTPAGMLAYKGMTPMTDMILAYLSSASSCS